MEAIGVESERLSAAGLMSGIGWLEGNNLGRGGELGRTQKGPVGLLESPGAGMPRKGRST